MQTTYVAEKQYFAGFRYKMGHRFHMGIKKNPVHPSPWHIGDAYDYINFLLAALDFLWTFIAVIFLSCYLLIWFSLFIEERCVLLSFFRSVRAIECKKTPFFTVYWGLLSFEFCWRHTSGNFTTWMSRCCVWLHSNSACPLLTKTCIADGLAYANITWET